MGFCIPFKTCTPVMGPTQPPIQWVLRTVFTVLKRVARGADNSLPTTAARARRGALRVITVPSYAFTKCCLIFKYKNNNTIYVYFPDSKNACPPLCIIF